MITDWVYLSLLWVSERVNEWAERSAQASEQCGVGDWVSSASEWANGRASGPLVTFPNETPFLIVKMSRMIRELTRRVLYYSLIHSLVHSHRSLTPWYDLLHAISTHCAMDELLSFFSLTPLASKKGDYPFTYSLWSKMEKKTQTKKPYDRSLSYKRGSERSERVSK